MINIYVGKKNLPENMVLIEDPDDIILNVPIIGTNFQKLIISKVDKGTYFDKLRFTDRFGVNLSYTCLSTGSKAMIELEAYPHVAICCDMVGNNAFKFVSQLSDCNVYFTRRTRNIEYQEDVPVMLNGEYYSNIGMLNSIFK